MQVNNTSTNFGSIQLSKTGRGKPMMGLIRNGGALETFTTTQPRKGTDIIQIREKLKSNEVAIVTGDSMSIIAKTLEDENFIFKKIVSFFDPEAKFVDDCPPTKFDDPFMDLFV